MIQKSRLLNLFDVGRTNQQERREIESGKTVIDGKPVAINSDFARQVIFLSQQLDTSERYIASLLHAVMSENPNIGPAICIELTISEFHQRRRYLVECLCYLLEAAEAAELNALPTYSRIENFVRNELISSSLASNIIKEIEDLGSVVGRADIARKNAGSITVEPTAQGTPTLSYDILNARYDSLKYERRHLGVALSSIARLGSLSTNEVKSLIEWLSANPNHAMTYYILTTVLVAFDPINPETSSGIMRQSLSVDVTMVTFMISKFAPSTEWKDPGLKATLLLKWVLFLTEARHRDASLENRSGFKTEELETQIWNAVQGDAFNYLSLAVVQLERRRGNGFVPSLISGLMPSLELQEQREAPSEEFKVSILLAFETLIRSLITHASSELRKIKQRQEDLVLANSRSDRTRGGNPRFSSSLVPDPNKPSPRPRNDIAMLYSFIGLLYSALAPESALQFWGSGPQADSSHTSYLEYIETTAGKLPAFLQWAVWSTPMHDLTMSAALYDMLAGLSKGLQCSELAYNFMARGGGEIIPGSMLPSSSSGGPSVSWGVIFGLLDSWAASFNHPRGHPPSQPLVSSQFGASSLFNNPQPASRQQPQPIPIGPKEVLLAQSFLTLLSVVVSHSVAVRITISGHSQFRAIPTLVSLIPLSIPLELKGAIFETLSAFCEPGAGAPGIEICKAVWTLMERLEVINVRIGPPAGFNAALAAVKGVEVELEEVEAVHRLYPATIPFLKLLSTLIHTPKRIPLKDRVRDVGPINTIPESLGQPYRLPGIGPFVSFVIDNVFARIPNREYSRPSDRWHINDLCLSFIERILASYELEPLIEGMEDIPQKNAAINLLLVHPGYDVMKRLLSDSPLQASILSYIVEGLEGFEKGFAEEEPFFRSTIVRVLRIVHRVLEIQDAFLDILVPTLSDIDNASIVGTTHTRSFFTKFDQALLFGPRYVPALAAYMAFPAHPELILLSVKILALISTSSPTSSLVTLIERCSDSDRILAGFMQIMGVESTDDVWDAEVTVEQNIGAGAADTETLPPPLEQGIRLAALDFLIQETDSSRPHPNLAHYLLFGTSTSTQQVQDPNALGSRRTAIHVLIDTVNLGIPRLKGKQKDSQHQAAPLFVTLPGLAERCYRVIYQLCVHPRTSDFMTRYLRTREDFFARQLLSIPSQIPASAQEFIQIQYQDGARVTTSVPASSAFLRLRSCIFDLVALELHILTNKGHFKGVSQLIDILVGNGDSLYDDSQTPGEDVFQQFHEIGQSNLRIIELLQSLMFDWSDSLTVQPVELQFLAQLNLHSCMRKNAIGCEIVDRNALFSILATAKHTLHTRGAIVTPAHAEQLALETTYVLESCAVENHRREVSHAMACNFESWRRLLDMMLTKCFDQLPHDKRENMLFDLLHILPTAARSAEIGEPTAILLSEAVLSCVTKLREDRRHQVIVQSAGGDGETGSLPAERLYGILRSILEGILDNNRVELVRGNFYASLINYAHLISSPHDIHTPPDELAVSLSSSITQEETFFRSSQSLVPIDRVGRLSTPSLEKGSLSVLKGVMDRLVTTISRDAIDGTEVWKTIAFMLLDALVHLSNLEKNPTVLLALTRHGILSNFVRGIKDADLRLQSVLKPDPDDLNPLYVYEAKLSLFIRMSQTRAGSERLLESQLIPVLAQCDYLDARPEADQSFMEHDSFLPSAIQRYHQLFMPALQVIDGMLATLGSKHTTFTNQAMDFLSNHSSTIVILLKTDSEVIPTALLDQIHLIVVLCTSVLVSVPKSELLSTTSGLGAIHAAILSLSARCLGRRQFFARILPLSDAEVSSSHILAFGRDGDTKFDVSVRKKEALLRKDIVAYIGAASEFTEPEITLILSPVTTTSSQERGTYILATIPTIGNALEALNNFCGDLTETLKQIADLSAELSSKDHIGVDNIQEIVQDIHLTVLQDLDIGQKRSLIYQELERMRADVKHDAKVLLDSTEMLLLLVWRHLGYYTDGHHKLNKPTHAMKFISEPEPETLRADVGRQLSPALQRLADLNYELLGHDWQANQGYIEIMCRRLRDTAGLHSEQEE
ncbi:nucleoporin Nup186/Nup192/Nup205 [Infundibulicybe gibba]|nr:nucleoporin Nup186/Nup192/Nup205 [Infundibulicybe gibba]